MLKQYYYYHNTILYVCLLLIIIIYHINYYTMISQENNHHINNTQNKKDIHKHIQIPYIKYNHNKPLLIHTDIDTYLCLCTYDYHQEITHFRYDPVSNKNEIIDKLKIQIGHTQLQTITIRTKSQNKHINNQINKQQQQQITVYAVVLNMQLNYNGDYIDHILIWKLTKTPPISDDNNKYAIIHKNSNDEQCYTWINMFVFQQSKMICICQCLLADSSSDSDSCVVLTYYKLEDVVAEISCRKYDYKNKYDYLRMRFNNKQRYLAHKINQIWALAFVEKNRSIVSEKQTNKCYTCFKIFNMNHDKENKLHSQLIDVKIQLPIQNKIKQNKQSTSDFYKNLLQNPAQTSDKTQNKPIFTITTIDDIWLVQQQVLYLCLKNEQKKPKQPTKYKTIQYFYNYKKQNLYSPAYKIEQNHYNVQFYNMFHRSLRQNYAYNNSANQQVSDNCPIFFIFYSQIGQFVYNSLSVNKIINKSYSKFIKNYGWNRLDIFVLSDLKPIIVYTLSSEFPWKDSMVYSYLCQGIMNFNCDQDLLMNVNNLLCN